MKRFFSGLENVIKGAGNALFSPAKDPRQSPAYAYQHQRELLDHVQRALANMVTAGDRLAAQTREAHQKLARLDGQAEAALADGQEDVARLVLERREIALIELKALDQQIKDTTEERKRLSVIEQRISAQIEAYFARQEIIAARHSAAEAQSSIRESLADVAQELDELDRALQEAEQKTAHMQASASAIDNRLKLDLSADSDHLEKSADPGPEVAGIVDDHLKALKRQMGKKGSDQPRAGTGGK